MNQELSHCLGIAHSGHACGQPEPVRPGARQEQRSVGEDMALPMPGRDELVGATVRHLAKHGCADPGHSSTIGLCVSRS